MKRTLLNSILPKYKIETRDGGFYPIKRVLLFFHEYLCEDGDKWGSHPEAAEYVERLVKCATLETARRVIDADIKRHTKVKKEFIIYP